LANNEESQEKSVYQTQDINDADAENTDVVTGDDERDFVDPNHSPKTSLNSIDGYKKQTSPFKVDSSKRNHIIIQEEAQEETQGEILEDEDTQEMIRARKANKRLYPVEGYPDDESLW